MSWNPTGISSSNYYNNLVSLHSVPLLSFYSPLYPHPNLFSIPSQLPLYYWWGHVSFPFSQLTHCFWVSETLSIEKDNLFYTFKNVSMTKERLYAKAEEYFRSYNVISVRKVYHVGVEAAEIHGLKFRYWLSDLCIFFLGAWTVPSIHGKCSAMINSQRRSLGSSTGLSTEQD